MIEYLEKPYKPEQIRHILNPIVDKWFFTRFKEFSLPQLFGVMEIHSRNNILVSAPTGATKTLTAFLSILNELIDSSEKGILENRVYCVYVSPLRALSEDIKINLVEPLKEMEKIAGKKLNIRVAVRTGDTSASEKARMLKQPPHILITTPESLAIMLTSIKFRELLKNVEWFIADEIHALAENKRGTYLSLSVERLNRISPSMTRIGLSATIAPLEEIAKFLVGYENSKLRNCKIVDVQFIKNMDLKVLSPVSDLVDMEHALMHNSMYNLIDDLIQSHRTTLIFTNTRSATERVVHHLKEKFPNIGEFNINQVGERGLILRSEELSEELHQEILGVINSDFSGFEEKRFDSVGPTVGRELRNKSIIAIVIVLAAIACYVAFVFRKLSKTLPLWAMNASALVGLLHDIVIPMGVFAVLGRYYNVEISAVFVAAVLTILGYTVSDKVVIFDRVRENIIKQGVGERGEGFGAVVHKSILQTLTRSLNTTFTTLLSLVAIYLFGGESIRFFALALIMGIFLGAYSSIFVASPLLIWWNRRTGRQ